MAAIVARCDPSRRATGFLTRRFVLGLIIRDEVGGGACGVYHIGIGGRPSTTAMDLLDRRGYSPGALGSRSGTVARCGSGPRSCKPATTTFTPCAERLAGAAFDTLSTMDERVGRVKKSGKGISGVAMATGPKTRVDGHWALPAGPEKDANRADDLLLTHRQRTAIITGHIPFLMHSNRSSSNQRESMRAR